MGASINNPVFHEELIQLAIKLSEKFVSYEDKFGGSREFAELMNSAGALVLAITEPGEFLLSRSVNRTGTRYIS